MIDLSQRLGAEFPEDVPLEHTIDNMEVGEKGFTLPWGMTVDEHLRCYLCKTYPCRPEAGGTLEMPIERRADGYYVKVKGLRQEWKPSRGIPWVGASKADLIPVKGFFE